MAPPHLRRPGELEFLRLALCGESVIDWPRLYFRDAHEVDRFLRLHLLDCSDPGDRRYLRYLTRQAAHYLKEACGLTVPQSVAEPTDPRMLFLWASRTLGSAREQRAACSLLRCARIILHLEARELLHNTALREADVTTRVDRRVRAAIGRMRRQGMPIVAFSGSPKSRSSVITKLLVRQETVAAQIFDRLRYRLVTERRDQVAPVLVYLSEHLFPFCNVIPGQSENRLVDATTLAHFGMEAHLLGKKGILTGIAPAVFSTNTSTARGFHSLKVVVELPIRIDDLIDPHRPHHRGTSGRILLPLVELQILDKKAAAGNERGASAHARYKDRQIAKVKRRLLGRP